MKADIKFLSGLDHSNSVEIFLGNVYKGDKGKDGENGKSAYEIAVENGFQGTEEEWLASLKVTTDAELSSTSDNAIANKAVTKEVNNLNANTGISDYEEFSDQKKYKAGTTVLKDGLLYTFITGHAAGAWDDEEVENFNISMKSFMINIKNFHYIDEYGNLQNWYIFNGGISNASGVALFKLLNLDINFKITTIYEAGGIIYYDRNFEKTGGGKIPFNSNEYYKLSDLYSNAPADSVYFLLSFCNFDTLRTENARLYCQYDIRENSDIVYIIENNKKVNANTNDVSRLLPNKDATNSNIGIIRKGIYKQNEYVLQGSYYAGKKISIKCRQVVSGSGAIQFYDNDGESAGGWITGNATATLPSNFYYARVNYGSMEVTEDSVLDISNESLKESIDNLQSDNDTLKSDVNTLKSDVGLVEVPMYVKQIISKAYTRIGDNGGPIISLDDQVYTSHYFQNTEDYPITVEIKGSTNPWYDSISVFGISDTEPIVGVTLTNIFNTSEKGQVIDEKIVVPVGSWIYINAFGQNNLEIIKYVKENKADIITDEVHLQNPLYGKKFVAAGDSFTEGTFGSLTDENGRKGKDSPEYWDEELKCWKTYAYWIAKRNGMQFYPNGISGSTMHVGYEDDGETVKSNPFAYERYKNTEKIPLDTDYLTIMFGLDESSIANTPETLGDKSSTDVTTWWGAWNTVLEYYLTNMPYCKIGIIIADAWMPENLRNATIEIAKYWGVPYLDLKGDAQVPLQIGGRYSDLGTKARDLRNNAFQMSADDPHPNPKAHLYRSTIIENFLRSL